MGTLRLSMKNYYPACGLLVDGQEVAITSGVAVIDGWKVYLHMGAQNLMYLLRALGVPYDQIPGYTKKGVRSGAVVFHDPKFVTLQTHNPTDKPQYMGLRVGPIRYIEWTAVERETVGIRKGHLKTLTEVTLTGGETHAE